MAYTDDKKEIYIILSQTGTVLSRLLRVITKKPFNHSSISPYTDLHTMYSFGRLNPYNPFRAGLVKEGFEFGTFKRFPKAQVKIIELKVTEKEYEEIFEIVNEMFASGIKYRYNMKGLVFAAFGKYRKFKNKYYCSEFISMLLKESNLEIAKNLGNIVHPVDFANLPDVKIIYTGECGEFKNFYTPTLTSA